MGESGGLEITGEEIASATGTIIHEVLCGFGQRLPKVYIEETKEQ
jgi:alanine racemase